ncbi:MAG: response regulator [Verrucomicrobiota bacterium]
MSKRMLVVDDSKTMRNFLSIIAKECDFETDQAEDGVHALEVLEEKDAYDIALVDWDMPRMNGLELVKQIRAHTEYDEMKMMMVTTHNAIEDVAEALNEGVNDFLMKPLTKEMLEDKLRLLGFEL